MKVVLRPYRDGGSPDPFERYLLDLADDEDDLIEQRMDRVLRWWNNNKSLPPPVGPMISALVKDHHRLIGDLTDPTTRRDLADRLRTERDRAAPLHESSDCAPEPRQEGFGAQVFDLDTSEQVVEFNLLPLTQGFPKGAQVDVSFDERRPPA